MQRFLFVQVLALLFAAGGTSTLFGADYSSEFLKEARNRGYGRVMVEYLTQLKESNRLPSELKETFDIEMSKALRVAAAKDAFNLEEREKWQAESKSRLEAFVKSHPEHPEVASAQSAFGDLAVERGLAQMRQSRGTDDKAVKTKHLDEARKAFVEARPRFEDAAKRNQKQFDEMRESIETLRATKGVTGAQIRRTEQQAEDMLYDWLENRFKMGLTEFQFAETFENPKDKERAKALAVAAKQFDAIYQDNRESLIGLTAHAWHGKAVDEAGDVGLAGEIYEEVLANAPDKENLARRTGLEELFAQVFYFRALLEAKKGKKGEFEQSAPDWLKTYRPWRKYDGYQGISLAYAKYLIKKAKKAPAAEKRKLNAEAAKVLRDMKPIPSEHQDDAVLALRSIANDAGADDAGSTTEAMILAADAAKSAEWEAAEKFYRQALELAKASSKSGDQKLVGEIEAAVDQVRYRLALKHYSEARFEEVLTTCGQIAQNDKSATGPPAAALAVQAALMMYAQAADPAAKDKTLERLTKIGEYTVKTWPDKAEADDARIAMGQAKLVQGKFDEAIDVFDAVNSRSERSGNALYLSGQTHWRLYTMGEKKDPAKGPARVQKAEQNLVQAVQVLRQKRTEKPNDPPPGQLGDAELLLGEVCVESGNYTKAVELLTPHVAAIVAEKPKEIDNVILRTFLASVRAEIGSGNLQKASETTQALMRISPDQPQVNRILVSLVTLMQQEWKRLNAAAIEASSVDLATQDAAKQKLEAAGAILAALIEGLQTRQQLDAKAQLFMGKTAMEIGRPKLGEPLYRALLKKADDGDATVPKQAILVARSELIGIVRKDGNFKDALEQVDKLLQSNPNVLSFMMERGRILQAWAEKDESKFEAAVQQWIDVRSKLQQMPTKPPEFYEVNYNAALCLYIESQKTNNPKKAQDAAKLLNALLFTNPKLNGPDTVAQYKQLLQKIDPVGFKKQQSEQKKVKDREAAA